MHCSLGHANWWLDAAENGGLHRRRHLEMHEREELAQLVRHARFDRPWRRSLIAQIIGELDEAKAAAAQVSDDRRQSLRCVNATSVDVEDQNVTGLGQRLSPAHEGIAAFQR